ncbi:MAG: 16S rRNA (cytosine(1402)-N(4))-methyltransferase [Bacillus subtilis]|nr:16S rRNA (cytosine(1402)-N(4))-methyltransferase [Bacillus subtilis]
MKSWNYSDQRRPNRHRRDLGVRRPHRSVFVSFESYRTSGFDRYAIPSNSAKTRERLAALGYGERDLSIVHLNFKDIAQLTDYQHKCAFILADLGVSSMQIDNPDRGFSFKHDGPLDLRMNPEQGIPAAYRLQAMSEEEIEGMLVENADEPNAARIAQGDRRGIQTRETNPNNVPVEGSRDERARVSARASARRRTQESVPTDVSSASHRRQSRIRSLGAFLDAVPDLLASGGRVAILSFHSGEDRLVKKAFQYYLRQGVYSQIAADFIRPSMAEQSANSRAKSAKLRWAEKK